MLVVQPAFQQYRLTLIYLTLASSGGACRVDGNGMRRSSLIQTCTKPQCNVQTPKNAEKGQSTIIKKGGSIQNGALREE